MTEEEIKRKIIMQKEPQHEAVKRPVGRPTNPNKKAYVKKGTVSTGRPKAYTQEIAVYICEQLIFGRSLTSICRQPDIPTMPTIYSWLKRNGKNFKEDFFNSDMLADQILDIADEGSTNTYAKVNKKTVEMETSGEYDSIERRRLRIKARQWLAAHLLPRKYSERMQLTGKDDKALIPAKRTIVVVFE